MNILQKQGEGNDNANGDDSTDDDDYNTKAIRVKKSLKCTSRIQVLYVAVSENLSIQTSKVKTNLNLPITLLLHIPSIACFS